MFWCVLSIICYNFSYFNENHFLVSFLVFFSPGYLSCCVFSLYLPAPTTLWLIAFGPLKFVAVVVGLSRVRISLVPALWKWFYRFGFAFVSLKALVASQVWDEYCSPHTLGKYFKPPHLHFEELRVPLSPRRLFHQSTRKTPDFLASSLERGQHLSGLFFSKGQSFQWPVLGHGLGALPRPVRGHRPRRCLLQWAVTSSSLGANLCLVLPRGLWCWSFFVSFI